MKLSKYIDHTILKQDANKEEIIALCKEAVDNDFASVCINPTWVATAYEKLKDTNVKVCTVVGFPLGATLKEVKAYETSCAIKNGASEIDMVINVGAVKSNDFNLVYEDIKAVVDAADGVLVKVIIETCLLDDEEKVKVCELAVKAGANFVKTSTGFSTGGATVADVKLMKETVKDQAEVKASGGVRTPEDFQQMIDNGATRIGTSSGIALVNGKNSTTNY